MREIKAKTGIIIIGLAIAAGLALTLFRHWEPSGDVWGSWLFARIFAESGRFIILDRSPLYILYLNMFRWLGYPLAVIVEYLVTSLILAVSLIVLLKRYSGLFLAVFAVILWLPFFQVADPPVQKLALALSCLAVAARSSTKANRFKLAVSYALLGCAYMLRSTYIIFIAVFAIWDISKLFRQNKFKRVFSLLRPRRSDWPVLIVLVLAAWFIAMQSPHRWNNAQLASSKWFPAKADNLADASFIQHYNWQYIYSKYGTFKDKDFYFTNQEVFNGADSMIGAIAANPSFVAGQIARNIKRTLLIIPSFTILPSFLYEKNPDRPGPHYIVLLLFIIPLVLAVFYGALRFAKSEAGILFIVANILLIGTVIISLPKQRYMHPLVPILIFSALWYGNKLKNKFLSSAWSKRLSKFGLSIAANLCMILVLIFFSNGWADWRAIAKDFVTDVKNHEIRIMGESPCLTNRGFKLIEPLFNNRKGVLSLEHKFIGAFADIEINKLYDIWEIPPFGHFSDSGYSGLYPGRVDCLIISNKLAVGTGYGTNSQIRYRNYIEPYSSYLKARGAKVYDIDKFGKVIILTGDRQ